MYSPSGRTCAPDGQPGWGAQMGRFVSSSCLLVFSNSSCFWVVSIMCVCVFVLTPLSLSLCVSLSRHGEAQGGGVCQDCQGGCKTQRDTISQTLSFLSFTLSIKAFKQPARHLLCPFPFLLSLSLSANVSLCLFTVQRRAEEIQIGRALCLTIHVCERAHTQCA